MTVAVSAMSQPNEAQRLRDIDRCRAEIADLEGLIRSGHPDVTGLCLALSDWSEELRILEGQEWKNKSSDT